MSELTAMFQIACKFSDRMLEPSTDLHLQSQISNESHLYFVLRVLSPPPLPLGVPFVCPLPRAFSSIRLGDRLQDKAIPLPPASPLFKVLTLTSVF